MTNDEAIKMIADDMRLHHDCLSGNYREALNMAIEALRNSTTQMSGTSDLISKQAVIDLWERYHPYIVVKANEFDMELRRFPSAQPERKQGKWIEVNDAYNRINGRCSVCGWESHLYEDDVVGMDYCPNCGARLEVE